MVAKPTVHGRTMKASEFKARCLELMDAVEETGESIVITKRGRPVARLVPATAPPTSLFGIASGFGEALGDIVAPLSAGWGPDEGRAELVLKRRERRRK